MAPRAGDDVYTNEEDAEKSALSSPESTSQPINDELTSDEVAESSMTISPSESHPSQISSDECLQEVPLDSLQVERSFEDAKEESIIDDFLTRTCGCKLGNGKSPCSGHVSQKTITQMRNNCHQMSRSELDFTIMAQLNALRTHVNDVPSDTVEKAFRPTTKYFVHGLPICQKMFCFLHTIGKDRLVNLYSFVDNNGVTERMHGNIKRTPHNATPHAHVEFLTEFIKNMGDTHGLPLPGRLPSHDQKVLLLPSDMNKQVVYRQYKSACRESGITPAQKSKFYSVWNEALPYIGTMKPSSDLCFECQQNITQILRSAHLSEEEKSCRLAAAEAHLALAKAERANYNAEIKRCTEAYQPGQRPMVMHYSFDYAQQVHFPNDPQQPGPAYFLTAKKCQLFGVACEPIGRQVNYLINEGEGIGKGANATVSLIHHHIQVHGLKEDHLLLHADNCVGQNKNNTLLYYLLFRVLMGYHKSITLSFMLAGHTKFAPDRFFGLIKKTYRRTKVETIGCIARVVMSSSVIGANIPQLIMDQSGDWEVLYYDWTAFFEIYFKDLKGITSYHIFRVTSDHPGRVFVRQHSQAQETAVVLMKRMPQSSDFPQQIVPEGLDLKRQWYLYEKIRPFCSSNLAADLTCPKPLECKPTSHDDSTKAIENPKTHGKRCCSICQQPGHTKRTCPTQ